jgi:hypothetical protein
MSGAYPDKVPLAVFESHSLSSFMGDIRSFIKANQHVSQITSVFSHRAYGFITVELSTPKNTPLGIVAHLHEEQQHVRSILSHEHTSIGISLLSSEKQEEIFGTNSIDRGNTFVKFILSGKPL